MEYQHTYSNLEERAEKIAEEEALGHQLLHDDFAPDWEPGEEPRGTLTFSDPIPKTDEDLYQEELKQEFNDIHTQAINAYKNWDSLTLAQKDTILKNLLKYALWREGRLQLGVL